MKLTQATILCVLLLTMSAGCSSSIKDDPIAIRQAKARELQLPLTPTEAAGISNVDPKQNAAIDMENALLSVVGPSTAQSKSLLSPGLKPELKLLASEINSLMSKGFNTGDLSLEKQAEPKLKAFDSVLDMIVKAMDKPEWDFNRAWDEGIVLLMPDLAIAKTLTQMLATRAYFRGLKGQVHGAVRDLQACKRLGAFYRTEPSLMSVLVGTAVESIALGLTVHIARRCPSNKALVKALNQLWQDLPQQPDTRRIWNFELISMVHSIKMLTKAKPKANSGNASPVYTPEKSRQARTELLSLYIESNQDWPKGGGFDKSHKQIDSYGKRLDLVMQKFEPGYPIEPGKDSMIGSYLKSQRMREARLKLARVGLAMILEGSTKGGYKLPAFASEPDWFDPYSGKPFILKIRDGGFWVYSVSENKVDDGGKSGDTLPLPDLVFGYPKRVGKGL